MLGAILSLHLLGAYITFILSVALDRITSKHCLFAAFWMMHARKDISIPWKIIYYIGASISYILRALLWEIAVIRMRFSRSQFVMVLNSILEDEFV